VYEITQCHLLHERHELQWSEELWRTNVRHALGLNDDPKADDPRYLKAVSMQVTDELRRILQPFPKQAA